MGDPGPVLLLSDLHAHYFVVNEQIAHAEATLGRPLSEVVVLGDFGLFAPNLHEYFRRRGERFTRPLSFIEGNHEDFVHFDALVARHADVFAHLVRGSAHQLGPWRCLCVGGARYMDAWSTPRGSELTDADVAACLSHDPAQIDLVISHDCPTGIGVTSTAAFGHLGTPGDPRLDRIAAQIRPRWWFFGHHHRWHDHERLGTHFIGLPQSWEGYVLLDADGPLAVRHEVPLPKRPFWLRWLVP